MFNTGFSCAKSGIDPGVITIALDYLFSMSINDHLSPHELFEIRLLVDLLPLIQQMDAQKYIFLLSHLCSQQHKNSLEKNLCDAAGLAYI